MRKNTEEYNAYMKKYMLNRYHERRLHAFNALGGKCAKCGIIPDKYEFDHIDPKQKSFTVARLWSINKERFELELSKCQILCKKCHTEKTLIDRGMNNAKEIHGTISSYRYCRCNLCRAAKYYYTKYKQHASIAQLVEQGTSIGVTVKEFADENASNSVNAEMLTPSQDSWINIKNKV